MERGGQGPGAAGRPSVGGRPAGSGDTAPAGAARTRPVIDPATSQPVALAGRVVTMDPAGTVYDDGVVYARDGSIVAVADASAAPPPGFADVTRVATGGTLFPGLIELHNHLPYDVLPLWSVPRQFTNRAQWSSPSTPQYHQLVSGPMAVLGRQPDVVDAIVRFVEVRALLGGTTTSQGIALAVDPGIVRLFRGLIRNVESTGDPALPPAATHIADVESTDAEAFLARLRGPQKLLLHLAEGTDDQARDHFLALQLTDGTWAVTSSLIGIHCASLQPQDFTVLAGHGGSMVWSPLSNLLLYGQTADLGAALAAQVPVALGSDWAPSGSKNLLGELKVARAAAPGAGASLSARDLVAMATVTPARMLGWDQALGSLEAQKRADLIVVDGTAGDPCEALLSATEADLTLVVINGVPRAGTPALMGALGLAGEPVTVGGQPRLLNLAQATADPSVSPVTAAVAQSRLQSALAELPGAAAGGPQAPVPAHLGGRALLAVAGILDNGLSPRPHLPYRGRLTGPDLPAAWSPGPAWAPGAAAGSLPLPSLTLDPLTAVDNPGYYQALAAEPNLPAAVKAALAASAPS